MLESNSLQPSQLIDLYKEQCENAKRCLNLRASNRTPLDLLQRDLEGVYVNLQTVKIMIKREAGI